MIKRKIIFSELAPYGKWRRICHITREIAGTMWKGAKILAMFMCAWLFVCAVLSIEL